MKKLSTMMGLLVLILALGLFAGCGEKTDSGDTAADTAADTEVVTHDCAGGCGMTGVPADKMTEIDGKWYCDGCKDKAGTATEGEGHEHKEGDGHDHG